MSIFDLTRELEDFSDQRLMQETQQPSGQYPPYLVVTEIQRRRDLRQRYNADKQKQVLSEPSIAEQRVMEMLNMRPMGNGQPQQPQGGPQGAPMPQGGQPQPQQPQMAQAGQQAPQPQMQGARPQQMPQQGQGIRAFARGGLVGRNDGLPDLPESEVLRAIRAVSGNPDPNDMLSRMSRPNLSVLERFYDGLPSDTTEERSAVEAYMAMHPRFNTPPISTGRGRLDQAGLGLNDMLARYGVGDAQSGPPSANVDLGVLRDAIIDQNVAQTTRTSRDYAIGERNRRIREGILGDVGIDSVGIGEITPSQSARNVRDLALDGSLVGRSVGIESLIGSPTGPRGPRGMRTPEPSPFSGALLADPTVDGRSESDRDIAYAARIAQMTDENRVRLYNEVYDKLGRPPTQTEMYEHVAEMITGNKPNVRAAMLGTPSVGGLGPSAPIAPLSTADDAMSYFMGLSPETVASTEQRVEDERVAAATQDVLGDILNASRLSPKLETFDPMGMEGALRATRETLDPYYAGLRALVGEQESLLGDIRKNAESALGDREALRGERIGYLESMMRNDPSELEQELRNARLSPEQRQRRTAALALSRLAEGIASTNLGDIGRSLGSASREVMDQNIAMDDRDLQLLSQIGQLEESRRAQNIGLMDNIYETRGAGLTDRADVEGMAARDALALHREQLQISTAEADAIRSAIPAAINAESSRNSTLANMEIARVELEQRAQIAYAEIRSKIAAQQLDVGDLINGINAMKAIGSEKLAISNDLKQPEAVRNAARAEYESVSAELAAMTAAMQTNFGISPGAFNQQSSGNVTLNELGYQN